MKTAIRVVAGTLLSAPIVWALHAFWKANCACSDLPFPIFSRWIWFALTIGAASGAFIGILVWKLLRRVIPVRVHALDFACVGVLLAMVSVCVGNLSAARMQPKSRKLGIFRFGPETTSINVGIREMAKSERLWASFIDDVTASVLNGSSIREDSTKLIRSQLENVFKEGLDGCALVRSFGRLDAQQTDAAFLYLVVTTDELLSQNDLDSIRRAMNAVWALEPSNPGWSFFKKLMEFRYLTHPSVRQFSEAAEKVQYAWRLWPYPAVDLESAFAKGTLKTTSELLRNKALLQRAKALLKEMPKDAEVDLPNVHVQIESRDKRAEVYHFAQRHAANGGVSEDGTISPSPESVASVAAYQLSILRALNRIRPNHLITETTVVPENPQTEIGADECRLRREVGRIFAGPIPASFAELSSEQVAYLFLMASGRIYQCLRAKSVWLWPDFTVGEVNFYHERAVNPAIAAERSLAGAARLGEQLFSEALSKAERAWWNNARFAIYREQRVAETVGAVVQRYPGARIGIIYGAAHDLKPSIEHTQRRIGQFSLTRFDWLHKKWFSFDGVSPDPLGTESDQIDAATSAAEVTPGNLTSFTSEPALRIAVQKLGERGYTIQQLVAMARVHYRVGHPEAPDLIKKVNALLDERLSQSTSH